MKVSMKWLALLLAAAPMLPHETLTTTVLFDREIVRILDHHCVMCHAAGGPAFPLETYDQTWLKKREIHAQVIARHMPPWAAVPGYGQFANDNTLTLRESSWVEGLGPRNSGTVFLNVTGPDAARPAEIRTHVDFDHWQLGKPDLNIAVPKAPNTGLSVLALGLKTSRQLGALEYMPDRRHVRAATFTIQETGQWIGSWTPWYGFMTLPKGKAYRLPAGAHIIADILYKDGTPGDATPGQLGLHFAAAPASNLPSDVVLETGPVSSNTSRATSVLVSDSTILALLPTLAPETQSIEVSARKPNGTTEVLLFAKDLRAEWPTPYILKTPAALPAGTIIMLTARGQAKAKLTITRY
jgi:hypothetical protein